MSPASGLQLKTLLKRQDFTLDLDLTLPGDGITALFGASGSGKTTVLRILAGLEPAARGRICVQGEVWQNSDQNLFKPIHQRALGYVFQEASLFEHLNVQGNLQYGFTRTPAKERKQSWNDTLALLGIGHLLKRWPHELSGGERQRVAIARALATSPRLLLLDEPLAALDSPRKAEILPYLERLQTELRLPVIYVTHAIDEVARLADHMVLLDTGRVTAFGPTAELLTRLDLPLARGDTAGAVLHCKVVSHDDRDHLTLARFAGGELTVARQKADPGQTLRVRVAARDVSLTLQRQTDTSILNILPCTVSAVSPDSHGQVMVSLCAGDTALLARVTTRSGHALGLKPGTAVYAQIKGVAVLG
ncbi:MAG: molybdenum ABC transporter ATP-binding protein [Rhodoferax sp.]|uniref:molybdenum ABC transporter ATP-binding protein n=1 Tax=Rhodoferax sp. TaxID=50421 RepID=UPI0008BC087A|nr:molybdenum ABC transporter ATP-binding protein [Rhodoferax sp.]MDP2680417.1 molybdenum ABC transporter ATP-binding protein [Rhodoferax sp.]OGB53651.1 MAG: molybdenum ABC transporter ATP-binding protein [Burkholderiales bacterium RIFOXYD12_FULL_59_19]OGB81350.1 MAG: molybdenum ABC transporter ATP-binding protein [Burkholderiales bacterium RIFOXYC12_FULL_60_6]